LVHNFSFKIDPIAREAHAKAVSQYEALHSFWKDWKTMQSNHDELDAFIKESDDKELDNLAREDLEDLERALLDLEKQIKAELLKGDEDDSGSAILEIRAGTGGDEAALFTSELYEMYKKVAQLNGWAFQELTLSGDGPKSVRVLF
jgi:peptide chain release factor 1